jgi:hypothetical protein
VVTVQVDSKGKIEKAWLQRVSLVGASLKAEIGYAVRKSDKPPTAGTAIIGENSFWLGPVEASLGGELDLDEETVINDLGISGGLEGGPISLTYETNTDGWVGVGTIGTGGTIGGGMMTIGEPEEINPNSIPLSTKIGLDIIIAMFVMPTTPLPTDQATTRWTRTDLTQIPIGEEVKFPDPNLEAAIRTAINKPEGAIYAADLEELKRLSAPEKNIKDIAGIEHCSNLQTLSLYSNQITDVSPLSKLTNLQWLGLSGNKITDVSPLSKLTNLQSLDLIGNKITDVSPLSKLTNLQDLYLFSNQITDVSPLSKLTNLQWLYLNYNQITDVSPLSKLTNLQSLYLGGNKITDVSPLSKLTNLQSLYLIGNN